MITIHVIRWFIFPFPVSHLPRYAPPGGQTSISLGDYVKPPTAAEIPVANGGGAMSNGSKQDMMVTPPKAPRSTAAAVSTPKAAAASVATAMDSSVLSAAGLRVGVAVCEADALKSSTVAALQRLGEDGQEDDNGMGWNRSDRMGGCYSLVARVGLFLPFIDFAPLSRRI